MQTLENMCQRFLSYLFYNLASQGEAEDAAMFERDYFMRMIGQMAQVMGQMMGLRKERKQEEALLIIDDLFNQQFRLNAKLIGPCPMLILYG